MKIGHQLGATAYRRYRTSGICLLYLLCMCATGLFSGCAADDIQYPQWSGVYPHLASFNDERECGTGAVVPWADRLWFLTYSPHSPHGSEADKLYEVDNALNMTIRPESIGGTPAGRLIHRESGQLFIGPYAIDAQRRVRAIPYTHMPGRHTGIARHLSQPEHKVFYATMEEGFYEVDVNTLEVTELWTDHHVRDRDGARMANLPGYHGKGLYSGQGFLVYSNNGQRGREARRNPDIPSGCLAVWDGSSEDWTVVRRNQFTEVTGPGGIYGNPNPDTDPVWTVGWDPRSLMLMVLDDGRWSLYRLPKASHTYDGAHGWNVEWPRIRCIDQEDLLMTMHGMFWRFPRTFTSTNSAGIAPRSSYLKILGDFCSWNGRLVFGMNVSARSEFLNTRNVKRDVATVGQSQSNLRFISADQLDDFGPVIGRGAVWLNDTVKNRQPSDPYLFNGFDRRSVHLAHGMDEPVRFIFDVDLKGDGRWQHLRTVTVGKEGYQWVPFSRSDQGEWIRVRTERDADSVTVFFHYSDKDLRRRNADAIFNGLATSSGKRLTGGSIRGRGDGLKTLHMAAVRSVDGRFEELGYYEMDLNERSYPVLRRVDDPEAHRWLKDNMQVPQGYLTADAASVIYVDDAGQRYRLPKGDPAFESEEPLGHERISREVVTERDLFNAYGTFYELPADNAGGFIKVRPITTHNRRISDYCTWRGLLVLSGIEDDAPTDNRHIIRSDDGKTALWIGTVDDIWRFGKPVGHGGPWKETSVKANQPSDPYLMTGYDQKTLTLSHRNDTSVAITIEVDIDGNGSWKPYRTFNVPAGQSLEYRFPDEFSAYWVRAVPGKDVVATAQFVYR